ncbi:MAG: hypothetical protein MUC96_14160 [Myxococcaceae bacterium]|nr:hypothetical protein [Myxococcaceae bacterium]
MACEPRTAPGAFDVLPVTKTPCGVAPVGRVTLLQGASATVTIAPTRSDVKLALFLLPDDVEAELEGTTLRVSASERARGDSVLSLTMQCEGQETLVEVPLTVTTRLRWSAPIEWSQGPAAREHPALLIDAASPDVLWLYGGFGFVPRQFTVLNDLWRLDLRTGAWSEVTTTDAPLVAGGRLAPTKTPGVFLFYGGQDTADEVSTTLYQLDTRTTPARFEALGAGGPGAALASFVFDAARDRWLVFGGFDGVEPSNRVYTLSLASTPQWTRVSPTGGGPSPRYGFFFALDGERLVVASGAQTPLAGNPINPANDTWALDLATLTWTRLEAGGAEAPARRNGCGAIDPTTRRLYAWSGTANGVTVVNALSVLPLGDATPQWRTTRPSGEAPVRASCAGVFDAARRRLLVGFGNTSAAQYADFQVVDVLSVP